MMADAGAHDMIEMVDAVLVKPFAIEQLHECLLSLTEAISPAMYRWVDMKRRRKTDSHIN